MIRIQSAYKEPSLGLEREDMNWTEFIFKVEFECEGWGVCVQKVKLIADFHSIRFSLSICNPSSSNLPNFDLICYYYHW